MGELLVISRAEAAAHLGMADCIALMREAMTVLSTGRTRQLLRSILDLEGGRAFGSMLGAMEATFGAKLISVFPGAAGAPSHQGVVALFDPETGAPVAIVDASDVTGIRTAAASAAATDALARPDARTLAIIGTGEQARRHAEAIPLVRDVERILVWGRSRDKAEALAAEIGAEVAETVRDAVAESDMICTVTASPEPVLLGEWVRPGTHLNAVGSSRLGPVEIDAALVARSRFFADHAEGVRRQGAEFRQAVEAGAIGEDHLLGEIGEVMAGTLPGRLSPEDVTIYKSLGSIVQDLAACAFLATKAKREGWGTSVPF